MASKILFSNFLIDRRSGTETFLRDVTAALTKRGHQCGIFTPRQGPMVQEFLENGVRLWDKAEAIDFEPDVIHGHHTLEFLRICARFPNTPALFMVHDATAWHDEAPLIPQLRCVATVSSFLRERVVRETGLPPDCVPLVFNGVDLRRFAGRKDAGSTLKRAAVFGTNFNSVAHIDLAARVCEQLGLDLDVYGPSSGRFIEHPETVLGGYDLVLATGRCAIEALCSGCTVVLLGQQGVGALVTPENFFELRKRNFGLSLLTKPLEPLFLIEEIQKHDSKLRNSLCQLARKECDVEKSTEALLQLYTALPDMPPLVSAWNSWFEPGCYARAYDGLMSEVQELHRIKSEASRQHRDLEAHLSGVRERLAKEETKKTLLREKYQCLRQRYDRIREECGRPKKSRQRWRSLWLRIKRSFN